MTRPHNTTTAAVQSYLVEIAEVGEEVKDAPLIRELLGRSAARLQVLCDAMLKRSYPRLMRPPLSLESEELLSHVVERLIKALRQIRPGSVRQFFALANRHIRWELDDLARRLDERQTVHDIEMASLAAHESQDSQLSATAVHILTAITNLPDELQEVFDLVRIQGLSHAETAEILQVSVKTIQRRLASSLVILTKALGAEIPLSDLKPK